MSDLMASKAAIRAFLRIEADLAEEKARRIRFLLEGLESEADNASIGHVLSATAASPSRGKAKSKRKRGANETNEDHEEPRKGPRPMNGYTLFMHHQHPIVKNGDSSLKATDIVSIVSKKWREMSYQEKESWKEMAQQENDKDPIMAAAGWGPNGYGAETDKEDDEDEEGGKGKKKRKRRATTGDKPKRRLTGYNLFMKDTHPRLKGSNTELTNKDVIRLAGKQWTEMTDESRESWREKARMLWDTSPSFALDGETYSI